MYAYIYIYTRIYIYVDKNTYIYIHIVYLNTEPQQLFCPYMEAQARHGLWCLTQWGPIAQLQVRSSTCRQNRAAADNKSLLLPH